MCHTHCTSSEANTWLATSSIDIGGDLAGILGGRTASAEVLSVPSGGGVWWGVSRFQPTRGSGERRELSQRGPGRAPAENGFWRILKATERSFLYLYDKNLRGAICISVPPTTNSGGTCPPRPPVIYAHEYRFPIVVMHQHIQRCYIMQLR